MQRENNGRFGGEITKSNVNASAILLENSIISHTGDKMLKIPSSSVILTGATYNIATDVTSNRGIERGKTYRISVWINNASDLNAKLFWSQGGNYTNYLERGLSDVSSVIAIAGDWSLIRFDVALPADYVSGTGTANQITVGLKGGASKNSYFDDFRMHSVETQLSGTVYDKEGKIKNILNKDNFYTLYVYDNKGQVSEIWQETPSKGVKKIKEYKTHLQGE